MKEYERSKYKNCPPAETVRRIKEILSENGIEVEEAWTESGVNSICSVRIRLKGTDIGQNGKGTDRDYAMASGYAEFMERLQTGYLLPECASAPNDREWLDLEEVPAAGGSLLLDTVRYLGSQDAQGQIEDTASFLQEWSFEAQDGKLSVIPFEHMKTGKRSYIPENILRAYYYTNGSCAGNSREEALVQGLSEIMERFATTRIMTGRLTPPVIDDEAFAHIPILKNAIDTIRSMEGLHLRIMDASCGMGLPVAAAVLTDQKRAKTILRFGAHPRFEIALERCLTEILQGRHIHRLDTAPVYDYAKDDDTDAAVNRFNFMKAAYGQFPVQLYGNRPSWKYVPWKDTPEDIKGQLDYLCSLYDRLGWEIYIRDCSYLGFPTYQLLVPKVSMVFDFGKERQKERRMLCEFRSILKDPDGWTWENIRKARRLAAYKRAFLIENSFSFLSGLPVYPKLLGLELDAGLLAGLTSLALYDRKRAVQFFRPYCFYPDGRITGIYPLVQLLEGNRSDDICAAMECICTKEAVKEAMDVVRAPSQYLPVVTYSRFHSNCCSRTPADCRYYGCY